MKFTPMSISSSFQNSLKTSWALGIEVMSLLSFVVGIWSPSRYTSQENLKFAVRMSGSERSFHPIVLTREFLVKTKLRAVTVADFYHRGGNGPTTTGGAVL